MKLDQTFMHFLLEHQRANQRTLNFLILMESILTAARQIDYRYRAGAMAQTMDSANTTNVQGENVMQMDLIAHEIVLHYLTESNQVIEATSEESDEAIKLNPNGRYLIYFDPLDGSSNIKHSLPVGFLFGIVKRDLDREEDCRLRSGNDFIAAGMFLIPSGMFTFALRNAGAWRFLMDETGVYVRPTRLYFPENKKSWELSWNSSNRHGFKPAVREWFERNESNYSFRYAGSLVVDFHRLLHNGGMFAYPAIVNDPDPKKNRPEGKLRLLYETAVVSFIAREAGGLALNEDGSEILDNVPKKRHQRSALYVGNRELVEQIRPVLR
jgi:fructose-1,6-bisphosphatase I